MLLDKTASADWAKKTPLKGTQSALKHGLYTAEATPVNKHIRTLLLDGKRMIEDF